MKNFHFLFQPAAFWMIVLYFCFSNSITAQVYTEISLDEEEHFNLTASTLEPNYYSIFAGASSTPSLAAITFFTVSEQGDTTVLEFIDIEIDDIILAGLVVGPNGPIFIYDVEFNLSIPFSIGLPPSGTIEDVQLLIVFLNNSGNIIGGLVRKNMSISLEVLTAAEGPELREDKIKVFPNPAKDHFTLEVKTRTATTLNYALFNAAGQQVRAGSLSGERQVVPTTGLAQGLYVLEVIKDGHCRITRKVAIY